MTPTITMTPERWKALTLATRLQLRWTMLATGQTLALDPTCDPDTVYFYNGQRTTILPLNGHPTN